MREMDEVKKKTRNKGGRRVRLEKGDEKDEGRARSSRRRIRGWRKEKRRKIRGRRRRRGYRVKSDQWECLIMSENPRRRSGGGDNTAITTD